MNSPPPSDKGPPPPPKLARRFFRWYCHPDFVEDLEGDLEELYRERSHSLGYRSAYWCYVRDVLRLLRPSIIRPLNLYQPFTNQTPAMFRNYFKTGLRNLLKYKSYALLNILGLAIGIAAALVLFLSVRYERSFDTFHSEYSQVYRIGERRTSGGESDTYYLTKTPVVPTLMETFPEVENGTRFFSPNDVRLRYQNNTTNLLPHYVDSGFTALFDFTVVAGSLENTLTRADHIALTQSVASQLFGEESGLGKVLEVVHDEQQLVVGAILADPPKNSSLQFEALLPWLSAPDWLALDQEGNWYNTFMTAYVKLNATADPATLEKKLVSFKDHHFTSEDLANLRMKLLPLADLRAEETSNETIISLLSMVALITLIIACVNFTNLATAQSLLRTREIGLRKAIGSQRSQLILQFLTESTLTCLIALLVGILLTQLTLPWFNRYFDLDLAFRYWQNIPLLATLVALGLVVGVFSGAYPALFASGMRPVDSLKGRGQHRGSGRLLQKGLIVLQYATSILLIAGTLVIWRQVQFMRTQDVNFHKDNVIVVPIEYNDFDFNDHEQAQSALLLMKNQLANEPSIEEVTFAENVPGRYNHNYNQFSPKNAPSHESVSLRQVTVGAHYFRTFGMEIVDGRDFNEQLASDSNAVIINQTAMRALGWSDTQDKFLMEGGNDKTYPVIGVVKDFHYESLQHEIQPLIHFYGGADFVGTLAARLHPTATAEGLRALEQTHHSLNPYEPFDYYFMDQEFDRLYKDQERLGLTATLFSGIAIIIASLGLLALAAFSTRQRRKEIGVRKVLGASATQVVMLLSQNFTLLVLIAFLVACPLIYYASDTFLQDFAYRISVGPDVFIVAGSVALLLAAVSVGVQAFRAASANPVHSLRDE